VGEAEVVRARHDADYDEDGAQRDQHALVPSDPPDGN
jgi:hypothetical protein